MQISGLSPSPDIGSALTRQRYIFMFPTPPFFAFPLLPRGSLSPAALLRRPWPMMASRFKNVPLIFPHAVSVVTRVTRFYSGASLAHVGVQNQTITFGFLQAVSAVTRIARCSSEASLAHGGAQNQTCTVGFPRAVSAVTRVTSCLSEASLVHVSAQSKMHNWFSSRGFRRGTCHPDGHIQFVI